MAHCQVPSAWLAELIWQTEVLILWLQPTALSEARRSRAFEFVKGAIQQRTCIPSSCIFLTGSFPIKTYLPDSGVDIMLCMPRAKHVTEIKKCAAAQTDDTWTLLVNDALCQAAGSSLEAAELGDERRRHVETSSPLSSSGVRLDWHERSALIDPGERHHPLQIRNVTFINGVVKVVRCLVNNIAVDVTVGKPAALSAASFLEEADRVLSVRTEAVSPSESPPNGPKVGDNTRNTAPQGTWSRPAVIAETGREGTNIQGKPKLESLPGSFGRSFAGGWGSGHPTTHLFKRSVLLVKAWCLYESAGFAALAGYEHVSVLNSRQGRLSSYTISIMVMSLFVEAEWNDVRKPQHDLLVLAQEERHANSTDECGDTNKNIKPRNGCHQARANNAGDVDRSVPPPTQFRPAPTLLRAASLPSPKSPAQYSGNWQSELQQLSHPLLVLRRFLEVFSRFDWDHYALSAGTGLAIPLKRPFMHPSSNSASPEALLQCVGVSQALRPSNPPHFNTPASLYSRGDAAYAHQCGNEELQPQPQPQPQPPQPPQPPPPQPPQPQRRRRRRRHYQHHAIGEEIYVLLGAILPDTAKDLTGKLTGMLLDMKPALLRELLLPEARTHFAAAALKCVEVLLGTAKSLQTEKSEVMNEINSLHTAAAALATNIGGGRAPQSCDIKKERIAEDSALYDLKGGFLTAPPEVHSGKPLNPATSLSSLSNRPLFDLLQRCRIEGYPPQADDTYGESKNSPCKKREHILSPRFPVRACNIVDPLDDANNLSKEVGCATLMSITATLYAGSRHLECIIASKSSLSSETSSPLARDCLGPTRRPPLSPQSSHTKTPAPDDSAHSPLFKSGYDPSSAALPQQSTKPTFDPPCATTCPSGTLRDQIPSSCAGMAHGSECEHKPWIYPPSHSLLELLYSFFPCSYALYGILHRGEDMKRPVVAAASIGVQEGLLARTKGTRVGSCPDSYDNKWFVEGSGFRADLLDHPHQQVPASRSIFVGRQRKSTNCVRAEQQATMVISDYDFDEESLTGDLAMMQRSLHIFSGEGRHVVPLKESEESSPIYPFSLPPTQRWASSQEGFWRFLTVFVTRTFGSILRRNQRLRLSPSTATSLIILKVSHSCFSVKCFFAFSVFGVALMWWFVQTRLGALFGLHETMACDGLFNVSLGPPTATQFSFVPWPTMANTLVSGLFDSQSDVKHSGTSAINTTRADDSMSSASPEQTQTRNGAPRHALTTWLPTGGTTSQQDDENALSAASLDLLRTGVRWVLAGEDLILGDMGADVYSNTNEAIQYADWQFRWLKDGRQLVGSTYHAPYMVIRNASLEDEGIYACQVRRSAIYSSVEWHSSSINPHLVDSAGSSNAPEKSKKRKSRRKIKAETSAIHITAATGSAEDAQDRVAREMGSAGPSSNPWADLTTAVLLVAVPPSVPRGMMIHEDVKEGQTLRLRVPNSSGVPRLHYQWKHSGFDIPGATSRVLVVDEVRRTHSGTYTCCVWNTVGEAEWSEAVVTVRTNRSPPKPYTRD